MHLHVLLGHAQRWHLHVTDQVPICSRLLSAVYCIPTKVSCPSLLIPALAVQLKISRKLPLLVSGAVTIAAASAVLSAVTSTVTSRCQCCDQCLTSAVASAAAGAVLSAITNAVTSAVTSAVTCAVTVCFTSAVTSAVTMLFSVLLPVLLPVHLTHQLEWSAGHVTQVTVARKLAELAARPPIQIPASQRESGMARVDRWMAQNTKSTYGMPLGISSLSSGSVAAVVQCLTNLIVLEIPQVLHTLACHVCAWVSAAHGVCLQVGCLRAFFFAEKSAVTYLVVVCWPLEWT